MRKLVYFILLLCIGPVCMAQKELDTVIISSTRSTRTIQNIPTRVEFIGGEELEEKGNMKPGDIRMLLNESTGINGKTSPEQCIDV